LYQFVARSTFGRPETRATGGGGAGLRSERAGVGAAVDQEVLAGDVARLHAADEGTQLPEVGRVAETAGRVGGGALGPDLVDRPARAAGVGLDARPDAVGVERAGQDVVDRDAPAYRLPRDAGDEARQPRARAVREPERLDRRLDGDRRDVDDPAEAALHH